MERLARASNWFLKTPSKNIPAGRFLLGIGASGRLWLSVEALSWDLCSLQILAGGTPVAVLGMPGDFPVWHLEITAPIYLQRLSRMETGAWVISLEDSFQWLMGSGMRAEAELR